jgi:hypothetical protein
MLMPNENQLTLRQVDLTRADFAAIQDDLDFLKSHIARLPTRGELAQTALLTMVATAGLIICWIEFFSRW